MFELNDTQGSPAIKKTMEKLSVLFSRDKKDERIPSTVRGRPSMRKRTLPLRLMKVPFILQSRRGAVAHPAPYFSGNNVNFFDEFEIMYKSNENFMFFIIATNYPPGGGQTQSHLMMGIFNNGVLYIIDPNGNDVSLDNVYSGEEFKRLSQGMPLTNTLYNSIGLIVRHFYDRTKFNLKFYVGDPIICPTGSPKNCTYRTVMLMLGFLNSPLLVLESAVEQANYMAEHKLSQVKTLLKKVFNNDEDAPTFLKNFLKEINKKLLRIQFFDA